MTTATVPGTERITCSNCNRTYFRKDFYLDKNSNPMKKCKKCMALMIDVTSHSTIMNIMEEVDIPFIPSEWDILRERYEYTTNKKGERVRNQNANQSILGRYIGKMKLQQFADFRYKDTPRFMAEHDVEVQGKRDALHKKIDDLLDSGYDMDTAMQVMAGKGEDIEDEIEAKLSNSQIRELKVKWGDTYNEDELIRLETFYSEMHESYDITSASHEDYLKQIVKTSMRMHSLIESGLYDEYGKLSGVYDRMMKSAKFTASQEKQEEKFIDSISEMVRLCEEVKFIPQYHTSEPQDIVDVTLRDLNNYTDNLVKKELNLDSLMEKGLEQIRLDEEKDAMSEDDSLFDEEITDDEILFEAISTDMFYEEDGGKEDGEE